MEIESTAVASSSAQHRLLQTGYQSTPLVNDEDGFLFLKCCCAQEPIIGETANYYYQAIEIRGDSLHSQVIQPKSTTSAIEPIAPSIHTENQDYSETSQQKKPCLIHLNKEDEVRKNMWLQLFPSDVVFYQFESLQKQRKQTMKKPICRKSMKKEIGYHCFDCFEDRKAIICEACFDASDHYGHRIFYQNQVEGCCDCGDIETLYSSVKQVGCPDHRGQQYTADETMDVSGLGVNFLQRMRTCIPRWFHLIFTSAESYERTKNPSNKEYQGKLLQWVCQVLENLKVKDDILLVKGIAEILTSSSNNWQGMLHDCRDYHNVISLTKSEKQAAGSTCTCSILDLLFRFIMSSFTIDEQEIAKNFLMQLMVDGAFKSAFTASFTRQFLFLHSTPPNAEVKNELVLKQISSIRNEVYGSQQLCFSAYATGAVNQLFEKLLEISTCFAAQKHEFDPREKMSIYQNYYKCYHSITQMITKKLLFDQFILQDGLFDLLLASAEQFEDIIPFEQEIAMQSQSPSNINTYLLYYRLTGQFNLFKIVANNLVTYAHKDGYQSFLLDCIKKSAIALKKSRESENCQKSAYTILARVFFQIFFAYFNFKIENVNANTLSELVTALGVNDSDLHDILAIALKRILQPISIYHEVCNKMWVFNGQDFEKQIQEYAKPDFELRVIDSVMVKVISKVLRMKSSLLLLMPQNSFTESLLSFKLKEKIDAYATQSKMLQENASNMISKSFFCLADYLSFMCYNVCSSLDLTYFLCISEIQSKNAVKDEQTLTLPAHYFVTLINAVILIVTLPIYVLVRFDSLSQLSTQSLDKKTLNSYYIGDIGKKAPVMNMLERLCSNFESQPILKILPQYENLYEPFNFAFNAPAKCKYFGEVEERKSVRNLRIIIFFNGLIIQASVKNAMIFGNIRLSSEQLAIAENTITVQLLQFLCQFFSDEFCIQVLSQDVKLKETLLFPVLKILLISAEIASETNSSEEQPTPIELSLRQALACLKIQIQDKQLQSHINYAEEKINGLLVQKMKQQESTNSEQQQQQPAVNNPSEMEQEQSTVMAKKQQALQRQREYLAQMQAQSKKFMAQIEKEAGNEQSEGVSEKTGQNSEEKEEETCCFCKEPLSKYTYGVLAIVQKNNLYLENKKSLLRENLKASKQLSESEIERVIERHSKQLNAQCSMTLANTCDHKIHLKCLQSDQSSSRLTQYEMMNKDIEIKCKICNQYLSVFLEVKEPSGLQEETLSRVVQKEKKRDSNGQSGSDPNGLSMFDEQFGFCEEEEQQQQQNLYDFDGGCGASGYENYDYGQTNNDESDNEVVEEIIYKKAKLNEGTARLIERQQMAFSRVRNICSKQFEQEKQLEGQYQKFVKNFQIQPQQQAMQVELETARMVFAMYKRVLSQRGAAPAFTDLHTDAMAQFTFFEQIAFDQIRYLDMMPTKTESDATLIKMARYLSQSVVRALAMLPADENKFDLLKKREEFCSKVKAMLLKQGKQQISGSSSIKQAEGYNFELNEADVMFNNLSDVYLSYVMVLVNVFGNDLRTVLAETLKQVVQIICKQADTAFVEVLSMKSSDADKSWLVSYVVHLLRRIVLFTLVSGDDSFANQKKKLEKIFIEGQAISDEDAAMLWVEDVLDIYGFSYDECVIVVAEEPDTSSMMMMVEYSESVAEKKARLGMVEYYSQGSLLSLLMIGESARSKWKLIDIGQSYLEYSKQNYKRKCALCKKISFVNDLVQCLICGEVMCALSCCLSVPDAASSLNRHTNIVHGGQSLFIDTQKGVVIAISNSHNTMLVAGSLYLNHLKQSFDKLNKCDWNAYKLEMSLYESLKKSVYELNVRNLIHKDHQVRLEKKLIITKQNFF